MPKKRTKMENRDLIRVSLINCERSMRIFINAKTIEFCENIKMALGDLAETATLCTTDEQAEAEDYSIYDALVVSMPLRTEFGLGYVAEVSKKTRAPIIVLARADIAADVQKRVRFTGAFVLEKPFTKSVLQQTVKMAAIAQENFNRLQNEKTELQGKLDDVKIVDRAKCCLIEYLNMTENQAHKHIQKTAMDTRRTQREVAEDILRTYSGMTNV